MEKEVLSLVLLCVFRQTLKKLSGPDFPITVAQTLFLIFSFFFLDCVFTFGPGSFAWISFHWLWKPKHREVSDIISKACHRLVF